MSKTSELLESIRNKTLVESIYDNLKVDQNIRYYFKPVSDGIQIMTIDGEIILNVDTEEELNNWLINNSTAIDDTLTACEGGAIFKDFHIYPEGPKYVVYCPENTYVGDADSVIEAKDIILEAIHEFQVLQKAAEESVEDTPSEEVLVEEEENADKKKLTYDEVNALIDEHNKEYGINSQYSDENPLWFVVVFKPDNWDKEYSLDSRSYKFRSDEKHFLPNMLGSSWFADSLDGTDVGVRLDWYNWDPDYFYQIEKI